MKLKYVSLAVATPVLIFLVMIGIVYWQNQYTDYPVMEQIEFQDGSVAKVNGNFTIYLSMKNTGIAATTIDSSMILYNGKLSNSTEYAGYEPIPDFEVITLKVGEQKNQRIMLIGGPNSPWQSGMTIEIMLQTIKGNQFMKWITLP